MIEAVSKSIIYESSTFEEANYLINNSPLRIALVVDKKNKLQGIVTTGDLRKGILKYLDKTISIKLVMNTNPITCTVENRKSKSKSFFTEKNLTHLPVLNNNGEIVDVECRINKIKIDGHKHIAVIMAGGLGTRLRPLTDKKPKPLLKIGTKPILENIIENCISYGFTKFIISVNYKGKMIADYFGDGTKWGIEIDYLNEKAKLGTAGSLSLIKSVPRNAFLVMNADLITDVNLKDLLSFHLENDAMATMCVKDYEFIVPYGVIESENGMITKVNEKPIHRFFVNAGLYLFNPEVLSLLTNGKKVDMPRFFEKIISSGFKTTMFPILEEWIDIGDFDGYKYANKKYGNPIN